MKKHEKFIEHGGLKNASHLQVSVYYTKGGSNYFTNNIDRRGYYVSVTPVTKGNGTISYTLFTGRKQLLLESSRYSEKQFAKAVEMSKDFEEELVNIVVTENMAA